MSELNGSIFRDAGAAVGKGGGSKTVEGNFLGAGIAAINLFLVDLDQP